MRPSATLVPLHISLQFWHSAVTMQLIATMTATFFYGGHGSPSISVLALAVYAIPDLTPFSGATDGFIVTADAWLA